VNEVVVTEGTAAALLELLEPLEVEPPLLPQAARRRAALPANAVTPTLLVTVYKQTTSLMVGRVSAYPDDRPALISRAGS